MIDGDVVFEGISPGDVVVVRIFATPDDAAGLVFLTGDGFEFNFDKTVLHAGTVFDADRVSGFAGLFKGVWFARGGIVGNNFPFGIALSGFGSGLASGWSASL